MRRVTLAEKRYLQLRFEAQNLLNHITLASRTPG